MARLECSGLLDDANAGELAFPFGKSECMLLILLTLLLAEWLRNPLLAHEVGVKRSLSMA